MGAVLYGFLSALFDYMGAIIAAVFIVVTGIILLGSKFYFEHKKEIQKRAKRHPASRLRLSDAFLLFFVHYLSCYQNNSTF